jgi:hypothetical protein
MSAESPTGGFFYHIINPPSQKKLPAPSKILHLFLPAASSLSDIE